MQRQSLLATFKVAQTLCKWQLVIILNLISQGTQKPQIRYSNKFKQVCTNRGGIDCANGQNPWESNS